MRVTLRQEARMRGDDQQRTAMFSYISPSVSMDTGNRRNLSRERVHGRNNESNESVRLKCPRPSHVSGKQGEYGSPTPRDLPRFGGQIYQIGMGDEKS